MKKLVLVAAAAAAISAASAVTPANALTIIKPGCCGGSYPGGYPHWGGGLLDWRRPRCRLRVGGYAVGGDCLLCAPQGAGPQYRPREQAPAGLRLMETTEGRSNGSAFRSLCVQVPVLSVDGSIDVRSVMIARRSLIFAAAAVLLGSAVANPAFAADDPVAIVNAIYARVTKGKGDSGGNFVFETRAAKAKYLSKSLIELWAKADARTAKGRWRIPSGSIPSPIRRIRT